MSVRAGFLALWLGGLVLLGAAILLGRPLDASGSGILAHQFARDAAEVTRIQARWMALDLYGTAYRAVMADIVFITVYTLGCLLAGHYYRHRDDRNLWVLGRLITCAALAFAAADYTETLSQLTELKRGRGIPLLAETVFWASWVKFFAFALVSFSVAVTIMVEWAGRRA
jgi:hypothetical protein